MTSLENEIDKNLAFQFFSKAKIEDKKHE